MARKYQSVPSLPNAYSQTVRQYSSASEDLEKAKARLNVLTEDPGNDMKLKLYGLYKQVGQPLVLAGQRWREQRRTGLCATDFDHINSSSLNFRNVFISIYSQNFWVYKMHCIDCVMCC